MSEQLWQVWYRVRGNKLDTRDGNPVPLAQAQRRVAALSLRDDVIRAWKVRVAKKQ